MVVCNVAAVLWPLGIMAVLGGALGLALAAASKKFRVEADPRVERVLQCLPGANCGGCGHPGCAGYAAAVVEKGAPVDLCAAGGAAVAGKIAAIMGQTVHRKEPVFAFVRCDGDGVQPRFHYSGVTDCKAASVMGLAGSFQNCPYGCLGLGSCVEACPFGAIRINANNVATVDEQICAGCGKCVNACPRHLIVMVPESQVVLTRCSNHDKGAKANKQCNHSCIACGKCVRACPAGAIAVADNVAAIDPAKCQNCGKCVEACPKHLIIDVREQRARHRAARQEAEAAGLDA